MVADKHLHNEMDEGDDKSPALEEDEVDILDACAPKYVRHPGNEGKETEDAEEYTNAALKLLVEPAATRLQQTTLPPCAITTQ